MAVIEVNGGRELFGRLKIQGSKNAVLPMLAACVLTREPVRITGCPRIQDVHSMEELLRGIGCQVRWEDNSILIEADKAQLSEIEEPCVKGMRSSVTLLGPLLGRLGEVRISYPGGCSIGKRPIDLHVKALRQMNVEIEEEERGITCKTKELRGALIELSFPSVGATENIILAAVLAKGKTTIKQAAREPEIICLCRFLKKMGADITGEGSDTICIYGVKELHGTDFTVISDRIAAGTYMAAVAGTGGEVFLEMDCMDQLKPTTSLLREAGADITETKEGAWIRSQGNLIALDYIKTKPYPGFPTDLQSPFMALLSVAVGISVIVEEIFEERFNTAAELMKMGADITIVKRAAVILGVKKLRGCDVEAHDLRGGAALVMAGLMAEDVTCIHKIDYIQRGYEDICRDFRQLGAVIGVQ